MKSRFMALALCIGFSIPMPVVAQDIYQVIRVGQGSSLNLRAWPSAKSRILVALPHNASWIVKTPKHKKVGNSTWQQVRWNKSTGWVNSHFLGKDLAATKMALQRKQCLANPAVKNKVCCGYPLSERQRPFEHIAIYSVRGIAAGKTLSLRSQPGQWAGKVLVAIPHNATWIADLRQLRKLSNGQTWALVRWSGQKGWVNRAHVIFDPEMTKLGDYKRKLCSIK